MSCCSALQAECWLFSFKNLPSSVEPLSLMAGHEGRDTPMLIRCRGPHDNTCGDTAFCCACTTLQMPQWRKGRDPCTPRMPACMIPSTTSSR